MLPNGKSQTVSLQGLLDTASKGDGGQGANQSQDIMLPQTLLFSHFPAFKRKKSVLRGSPKSTLSDTPGEEWA